VSTKEVEKITPLPDDLKRFQSLELLISPAHPYRKMELKKRFDTVFKKAKTIKIPKDIDIDDVMNEMNDALL
jgi:hypothetical protein